MGYSQKNNTVMNVKCVLFVDLKYFISDHKKMTNYVENYGEWKIAQSKSFCAETKDAMQKLLNIYSEYEGWIHDYEYGGCTDSSSEDDVNDVYEEKEVGRYKRLENGALEYSLVFQKFKVQP